MLGVEGFAGSSRRWGHGASKPKTLQALKGPGFFVVWGVGSCGPPGFWGPKPEALSPKP